MPPRGRARKVTGWAGVTERVARLDEILDVPVLVHDAVDVQIGGHRVQPRVVVGTHQVNQSVGDVGDVSTNLAERGVAPDNLFRFPPVVVRGPERVEERVDVVTG